MSFNLNKKNNFQKKGFTLIESLVAVSIFSLSILALISVLATGIQDINFAKRKIIASYLAQEGLEHLRNLRDTYVLSQTEDWTTFKVKINPCNSPDLSSGCYFVFDEHSENNIRNTEFSTCTNSICPEMNYNTSNGRYYYGGGDSSGYHRKISTQEINPNEIKVVSTVYWNQGSGQKSVSVSDVLFNWWEQ